MVKTNEADRKKDVKFMIDRGNHKPSSRPGNEEYIKESYTKKSNMLV